MAKPRPNFDEFLRLKAPPVLGRRCDIPSCACAGEYRAPKARERLNDYFWFCLDHVRAYNASWDYYAGMSTDQIEAHLRADTLWHRPTWPLGGPRQPRAKDTRNYRFRDDFGLFDDLYEPRGQAEPGQGTRAPHPQAQALALFEMSLPVTFPEVRVRYKELVKQHHPDANGGDKGAEERLKLINEAYVTLRTWLISA